MMRRRATQLLLAVGLAFSAAACGGGDDNSQPTDTTVSSSDASDDPSTSEDVSSEESVPAEEAASELPPPFPEVVLQPSEPGPRPLLAWDAVEGAANYQLIVLDGDGAAYWAWSGTETSVFLGGMENQDAVGAWVFEPLTWVVAAEDADGATIAMSARAELLP